MRVKKIWAGHTLLIALSALPARAEEATNVPRWLSNSTYSTARMATQPDKFILLSTSSVVVPGKGTVMVISFWQDSAAGLIIRCRDFDPIVGGEPGIGPCFAAAPRNRN